MLPTQKHIEQSTSLGTLAVWEDDCGLRRFEVGRGMDGYHAFRYVNNRLICHCGGLMIREVVNLIDQWIDDANN